MMARCVQNGICHSLRGTLRGMLVQHARHFEAKVVGCLKGAIWNVVLRAMAEL